VLHTGFSNIDLLARTRLSSQVYNLARMTGQGCQMIGMGAVMGYVTPLAIGAQPHPTPYAI